MDRIELNIALYKKVYLVRMAEEKLREVYPDDEMKTPTHLSIGEEAIVAGVCQALSRRDQVFGTYRSHGLYLARTEETNLFFAELFGKKTGMAKGKTGSMHLHSIEHGFLGSSAVVATSIPVAVGAAYANKVFNNGKVVVSFFGDGATEEGSFWESLNVACLKQIPILFVCEDNNFAIHSHITERQGFSSITDVVSRFRCHIFSDDTTDPEKIYELTSSAIDKTRTTKMPSFIHLKYYRYVEHVGINEDFHYNYRPKEEYLKWLERDPVKTQRRKLLELGVSDQQIVVLEKKINEQINYSITWARKSEFPHDNELFEDVYGKS